MGKECFATGCLLLLVVMWSPTRASRYNCSVVGGNCSFATAGCAEQDYPPKKCWPLLESTSTNLTSSSNCYPGNRTEDARIIRPTNLNVTVEPYNLDYFVLRVSWKPVTQLIPGLLRGYYVWVTRDEDLLPSGCVEVPASATSAVFLVDYFIADKLSVELKTLPFNTFITLRASLQPPETCHDFPKAQNSIKYRRCGPPTPVRPTVRHRLCLLPGEDSMSLTLDWDHPTMPPGYQCCDKYFVIFRKHGSYMYTFVQVSGGTSVTIQPLNSSLEYYVGVQQLSPCAFQYSCGSITHLAVSGPSLCDISTSPTPAMYSTLGPSLTPSPSPPRFNSLFAPPSLPPPSVHMNSSSSAVKPSSRPTEAALQLATIISPPSVVALIVVLILSVLGIVCYCSRHRHRYSVPSPTGSEMSQLHIYNSPPCSPICLTPDIEHGSAKVSHVVETSSSVVLANIHHVVVVFSEKTPPEDKDVIISYLYYQLGGVPGIRVVYYDVACRRGPSSWVEEEVGRASAVLVVCNKALTQEWGGEGASVIHALHALVRGHLNDGRDPDRKYAVVLLMPEDRQHIPQGYLRNSVQFLINDVERMARYIQQVPEHIPNNFL